ncbi:MAG: stage III sporulation protein AC [Bacillota bacterium]
MDVQLLFKIAGVGIIVAVMATVLKQAGKDEQGQMVTLVGVLLVLMMVVTLLGRFFGLVRATFGM